MNTFSQKTAAILSLIAGSFFTIYAFSVSTGPRIAVPVESKPLPVFEDSLDVFPAVMVKNKKQESVPLGMNMLKADVQVIGNIAVTTLEMTFFNHENRVLEGELYFPLAAGQTVSRFALEIDGKMREGVVVGKKEARIAYESTVRQKVDPGLLEWTKGNNFKARIYPIPANGTKRILVAYTQELCEYGGQLVYHLPMKFRDTLKSLDVQVEVMKQHAVPVLQENELHCFRFERWQENYKGEMHLAGVTADRPLVFGIPFQAAQQTLVEQGNDGEYYFYSVVHPRKDEPRPVQFPSSVSVVWDVSGSASGRDLEKELILLGAYLGTQENVSVELVTFSNDIHYREEIQVTGGDCGALFSKLRSLDYDGATQLGSLDLGRLKGTQVILSSDCLGNFGEQEIRGNKPVHVWNSSATADHSRAQFIADQTGGRYINLSELTAGQALEKMTHQQLRFLGIRENPDVTVTSDRAGSFTDNFSIAGKFNSLFTPVTLLFGYGQEITQTINIVANPSMAQHYNGMTAKIYAQKKIAELDVRYDQHKEEITALGKKYGIVTRNTSLLVLDRVEDYLAHRIAPPEELRKAYDQLLAKEEKREAEDKKSHMEKVVAAFSERKTWWNKTFAAAPPKPVKQVETMEPREPLPSVNFEVPTVQMGAFANSDAVSYSVSSANVSMEADVKQKGSRAKGEIYVVPWDPATPYISKLKSVEKDRRYAVYLSLKKEYSAQPSFFIDVADFFIRNKEPETALRILSNIAEMELENPQLLRILAHRLEQLKKFGLAISVFREVKELRPEEPQSYRDLALVYAMTGEDQKAVDELYHVVSHSWDGRFADIESLAAFEMNTVIANAKQPVNTSAIDSRLIYPMPVDMRVVINWDTDACDIDLWVTDPHGEKCYYSNKLTAAGGRMSNDFTGGYGPEEFIIKKAIPGNYIVEANYFGNSSQSIAGATTIQVQMTTNYGRGSSKTEEITRRLEKNKEVLKLATFTFKGKATASK